MTLQELEQLIIKEFPELQPYIYYKTAGKRWIEEHLLIGYEEKDLFFADIEVTDDGYAYARMLHIEHKVSFPTDAGYTFMKEYPSRSAGKEFAIDEIKEYINDIKCALDYFKDFNPKEIRDQLVYLGFDIMNSQEISFNMFINNTEILIQIPSGLCLDYSLTIMKTDQGTSQNYSFKNLDEVLKFLME